MCFISLKYHDILFMFFFNRGCNYVGWILLLHPRLKKKQTIYINDTQHKILLWITFIFLTFKYILLYIYVYIYIYNKASVTRTFILTVPPIVSFWDPRKHYKCWHIESVLHKAWWWLNTVKTCCLKCNYIIEMLCLTGICILYGFEKHNGMTNVKINEEVSCKLGEYL